VITDSAINFIFGIAFISVPIYLWWQIQRTVNWPSTRACVVPIDTEKKSITDSILSNLSRGPSYAIEYEVNGKKYVKHPDIENNVRVGGFKVWKSPAINENFNLRYHPNDPNNYRLEHALKPGTFAAIVGICLIFGVVQLYRGFMQYGT
jgi:hypothetical protein